MTGRLRTACSCLLLLASAAAVAGAREDIRASMDKMLAARSYHATMQVGGARPMTSEIDFVAPDRYRMSLPMGTQTIVGDRMMMSIGGHQMAVPLPKGTLTKWRDPANLDRNMATMTARALGVDMLDGHPAKKYRITNSQPQPSESTLWIGAGGYPLQIRVDGKDPATIRYSRFNDPTLRIDAGQ
jgi:outer membrane lipoprotein-sorting protein